MCRRLLTVQCYVIVFIPAFRDRGVVCSMIYSSPGDVTAIGNVMLGCSMSECCAWNWTSCEVKFLNQDKIFSSG